MNPEYLNPLINLGAVGVILILFVCGKLVSQDTVDRITRAQVNHIGDLKEVTELHLVEIKNILKEIRDNGSMKGGEKR